MEDSVKIAALLDCDPSDTSRREALAAGRLDGRYSPASPAWFATRVRAGPAVAWSAAYKKSLCTREVLDDQAVTSKGGGEPTDKLPIRRTSIQSRRRPCMSERQQWLISPGGKPLEVSHSREVVECGGQ